ncbi:dimethylsulfonioproprionate lyase family protein [Pseudogemmobacter bohemicus]|uniref:dimethylsulfonioproprionate lyase family protein n=1 Tax=Pseudogemmobacter bohemicus TaxID=2250708 RepID=UPI000DD40365|nr:dimethylsulfonioproprionate lyase family protein [Pseudogemmobacter bohemicus]
MSAALWLALAEPAGPAGSGRRRYAAAMALHGAGLLSTAQLESYREAATTDAIDPHRVMADRGLAPPEPPEPDLAARLSHLLQETDRCLSALTGPGIAEIRSLLAPSLLQRPVPRTGSDNPVVRSHIAAALEAMHPTDPTLAAAIGTLARDLPWITYDAYPLSEIGPHFGRVHAFCTLVGAGAAWPADDFDLGLFLVAPGVLYRDHAHPAPELYLPLTGPHRWRFAPDTPFRPLPAFHPVWNPPLQPHATLTGAVPFLSLFAWTRDVDQPAHVLPASDWSLYE